MTIIYILLVIIILLILGLYEAINRFDSTSVTLDEIKEKLDEMFPDRDTDEFDE